ncbi:PTS sugar transporter subunit IIB [Eubacteriales bacterium OttesenSCG-928-N14]|nr:PTS sugar transporter subunit IIB [Eubacteriales bacterium OttesenSCG-928-N14]
MANYMLFRIDNRLVHGQVCTAWIPEKSVKRVVIIHDEYALDEFLVDLHRMVVPKGVVCDTITTEEAAKQWKENQFGDQNTIVLFQKPDAALKAYEMGIVFDELQLATLAGSKNSVTIYKQVNVDAENAAVLKSLIEKNVFIYCQMFPADSKVSVEDLLEQKKTKDKLGL